MKKIILIIIVLLPFLGIAQKDGKDTTHAVNIRATRETFLGDTTQQNNAFLFMNGLQYCGFKYTGSVKKLYLLPVTDGTSGQALATNGSQTLSWNTYPDTANVGLLATQNAWFKYNSFKNTAVTKLYAGTLLAGDTTAIINTNENGLRMFGSALAHGMTSILPDNCAMEIVTGATTGNTVLTNASSATNGGFSIKSYNAGGTNSTLSNINLYGGKKSGTTITSQSASGYILTVFNAATRMYDIMGDGNFVVNGQNFAGSFGVSRRTTSLAGRDLTLYAGGAYATGTGLAGGNVNIVTGTSTGTGTADFVVSTSTPSSGTTDNVATEKFRVAGIGTVTQTYNTYVQDSLTMFREKSRLIPAATRAITVSEAGSGQIVVDSAGVAMLIAFVHWDADATTYIDLIQYIKAASSYIVYSTTNTAGDYLSFYDGGTAITIKNNRSYTLNYTIK